MARDSFWRLVCGLLGLLCVSLIALGWAVITYFGVIVHQIDPIFDLSPSYEMWHWPGTMMKREKQPDGSYGSIPAPEFLKNDVIVPVTEIGRLDNGLVVGKTEQEWFAVDPKTDKMLYPFKNIAELKAATGLSFDESQISAEFPWELMRWRPGVWRVPAVTVTLCIGSLVAFGVLWVRFCRWVLARQEGK
jgi:hypothetical protein